MRFILDEEAIKKEGLSNGSFLLLLLLKQGYSIEALLKELADQNRIIYVDNKPMVTHRWANICDSILLSGDVSHSDKDLESIASKMMELFPKGKKEGTPYAWKCNIREVVLSLKRFFKLYGNYTEEQILKATKEYVDTFAGNYKYMCLLKYFIHKNKRILCEDGKVRVEEVSELASYIENEGQEETRNNAFCELL